jgi:ATP-dependent DNA helicase RecG
VKTRASDPDRRLSLVVAEGEGQRVEFKQDVGDLAPAMVAFANASGGSIFVGLNDQGTPSGLRVTNRFLSQVQDIARNCDPAVPVSFARHGDSVLELAVAEGVDKPYRCRDGFYLRVGPNSQKLKRNEIRELIVGAGSFHFDELPNRECVFPRDIDQARIKRFLELAGIVFDGGPDALLLNLDVARRQGERIVLNNAAVLFFAKEPQRFLRESYCTAVRYQGTDRFSVIDRQDIVGDPITIVEEALRFVKRNIAVETIVTSDARHQEVFDYPLVAVREAITNAVAHRDYHYDASHVYIHIFADRLEIENPGGLPAGLRPAELGQRSVRRNRAIADLLFRAKYIERIGSGITRMRNALAENNNPPFEVTSTSFFVIRFLPRIRAEKGQNLTTRQARLHRLVTERGSMGKREAAACLGVGDDTVVRDMAVLIAAGLVKRQGVGKATRYVQSAGQA